MTWGWGTSPGVSFLLLLSAKDNSLLPGSSCPGDKRLVRFSAACPCLCLLFFCALRQAGWGPGWKDVGSESWDGQPDRAAEVSQTLTSPKYSPAPLVPGGETEPHHSVLGWVDGCHGAQGSNLQREVLIPCVLWCQVFAGRREGVKGNC